MVREIEHQDQLQTMFFSFLEEIQNSEAPQSNISK